VFFGKVRNTEYQCMTTKLNFIIISTADWDNPFWTNKQHVAKTLSNLGYNVVYFDSLGLRAPSKKSSRDLRRIINRLIQFFKGPRKINSHLTIFSPLVIPLHSNPMIASLNQLLMKLYLKFFEFRLGGRVIYWTYNPLSADLLKGKDYIYHCVDDLTAAPGLPIEIIKYEEENLIDHSLHTFVTSITLKKKFLGMGFAKKVTYFPNVIDREHFSRAKLKLDKPADLHTLKQPIIGFIGAVSSYKVDFELIVKLAKKFQDASVVLIGQVGEGQPDTKIDILEGIPNIYLLGPKKYHELPEYLSYFDVALLPCVINDYTRSMFPMKFFEYLAAGKKVISTRLDSLLEFEQYCYLAENDADFISKVEKVLIDPNFSQDDNIKINTILNENTWEVRTKKMLKILSSEIN